MRKYKSELIIALLIISVTSAALNTRLVPHLSSVQMLNGMDRSILLPTKVSPLHGLSGGAVFQAYKSNKPGRWVSSSIMFAKYVWIEENDTSSGLISTI